MTVAPRSDQEPAEESVGALRNIISGLEGGPYWLIHEVSELTGIPVATIRYWYRRGPNKGGTKAPSKQYTSGGMTAYLWTAEDLEEVKARRNPENRRVSARKAPQ